MNKETKCPICKKSYPNLNMHIRREAASEAFNREFIPKTKVIHLDYIKEKFEVVEAPKKDIMLIQGTQIKLIEK